MRATPRANAEATKDNLGQQDRLEIEADTRDRPKQSRGSDWGELPRVV
jgi:hypothetical protein